MSKGKNYDERDYDEKMAIIRNMPPEKFNQLVEAMHRECLLTYKEACTTLDIAKAVSSLVREHYTPTLWQRIKSWWKGGK